MFREQSLISLFIWHTFLLIAVACHDYKGFDDSILFKLNWPGKLDSTFSVGLNHILSHAMIYFIF